MNFNKTYGVEWIIRANVMQSLSNDFDIGNVKNILRGKIGLKALLVNQFENISYK